MTMFLGSNIYVGNEVTLSGGSNIAHILYNEQWKRCDNDADLAVLSLGQTVKDYAWLCDGGVWTKAYHSGMTLSPATNPSVLDQCDATPADCTDLVGIPYSDFDGSDCASSSTSATLFALRHTAVQYTGTPTISINNGKARIAADANQHGWVKSNATAAGGFTAQVDMEMVSGAAPGRVTVLFTIKVGGTYYDIRTEYLSSVLTTGVMIGSTYQYTSPSPATSLTAKWVQSGSTLTAYINGSSVWSTTNGGNLEEIYPAQVATTGAPSGCTGDFSNFVLLDASGNPVRRDPTGVACT